MDSCRDFIDSCTRHSAILKEPVTSETSTQSRVNQAHQWLDQHGDYLFGYTIKRLHNVDAAEDLVQDTLLAAMSAQHSFAGRSTVQSWLIGILKHKIGDHLRRARTAARSAGKQGDENAGQPSEDELDGWVESQFSARGKWKVPPAKWGRDPSAESEREELGRVLSECLEKLPPRAAEVFLLNETQAHGAEILSKVLELSTTNIGVILYRARMALRRCLEVSWFGRRRAERKRET